jgi:hypothetical protein
MDPRELMTVLDISAQVMRPPFEIIQSGVDHQRTFAMGHAPSEEFSEADPPIRLTDVTDGIVIDGLLGQYNPNTQEITIFREGISHVAVILKVSPEDLTQVVRLYALR